jgi:hypothetical protein
VPPAFRAAHQCHILKYIHLAQRQRRSMSLKATEELILPAPCGHMIA